MKRGRIGRYGIIILLVLFGTAGVSAPQASVDNSLFADLLKTYVKDGVVDYGGFKRNASRLDDYLRVLEAVNPESLDRDGQFAFYVNAYNAWTIKLILSGYPEVESIKELGSILRSPWKKKIARLNGQVVTLDHIEHEILRPRFGDPRVHFAVNCASKGCPPLLGEPYRGDILDRQLDAVTTAFINDPKQNRLEGSTLFVSRIFKWFREDFNNDIVGFFLKYAQGSLKEEIERNKDAIIVKYLDYDWSLNGS